MKCPGQDSRFWKPDDIFQAKCPECGAEVEFFKDDTARLCKKCGRRFMNPKMDFGCASYCKYADQCLGDLSPELLKERENLFKDRVAMEMKNYFGTDFKRISHADRVARYAKEIGTGEGGDMAVVLTAAYLHDIGIKQAEARFQSSAAKYQEELGPPIARDILEKLGASPDLIEEVCDIIGHHHHPRSTETVNFRSLYDADLITNLQEKYQDSPPDEARMEALIASDAFLTESGRVLAKGVFLK